MKWSGGLERDFMGIAEQYRARDENPAVRQRTLKSAIDCAGIALHSGAKVHMTLIPAEPDTGILFKRTDIENGDSVLPARWDRVVDTRLCTMIGNEDGVTVGTIEHLMSAFAGCGIDNAVVELDGPEVPVMDGSAEPFVFLIECAGVIEQNAPRRCIRILQTVTYKDDHCSAALYPGRGFAVSFDMDYVERGIEKQAIRLGLVNGTFKKELSRARTFGFLQDVEMLRAVGLARGGSLENAVVIDDGRIMNPEGLRYDNEFVRHKSLDAVGDLYLAGAPILGQFHGRCSGHAANNRLLRRLFENADAWCYDVLYQSEEVAARATGVWGEELPLAVSA